MRTLINYLVVGGAGCLGAMFRYFVGTMCGKFLGTSFPIGTFVINISGSFFLGWFFTFTRGRIGVSDTTYLAVAVGFTGAYTTFSTWMLESTRQLEDGAAIKAMLNLVGSLVIGLIAVRAGMILGSKG